MLHNKFFAYNTGTPVEFLDRQRIVLETLLPVLPVSRVSFLRWLLGSTGLYQISQQSHLLKLGKSYIVNRPYGVGLYMLVLALSSCSLGLLNGLTGIDLLSGLAALRVSISCSPYIRNLINDFSWNLHVCVIPSINKYWGATDLKKNPEIFLCTARCRMALSAMLLFHGIPSYSLNVKSLCRYRLKRL